MKPSGEQKMVKAESIRLGFGWDMYKRQYAGGILSYLLGANRPVQVDCDGSAFFFDAENRQVSQGCTGYDHTSLFDDAVTHSGDNATGDAPGEDEQIRIRLTELPTEVTRILFTLDILKNRTEIPMLGMVPNLFVRLSDGDSGEEIARMEFSGIPLSVIAMAVGMLEKRGEQWYFCELREPLPEVQGRGELPLAVERLLKSDPSQNGQQGCI